MSYRILMIAPTSFFGDYGCHVRILEETLALQRLGHRVRIVTYPRGRDFPNLEIERTMPIPWRVNYEVGSSRHKLGLDLFLTTRALRAARRFKPDIIHAHLHEGALIGALVSRVFGKPLVFDFQGSLTNEMIDHHFLNPRGRLFQPLSQLEKIIDHTPNLIFTSSQNAVRVLTDEFNVPTQKIVPIADAVDTERFHPLAAAQTPRLQELREYLGIPRMRPVVVYLGLLADYQGTRVLLDAAEKLVRREVDTHFLILGFPGVAVYADYARKLGIAHRVSLPGKIPYDDAPTWLALGDIAVAPKMSLTEGNGKILNYMAMGLPVVAFDHPVAHEYLADDGVYATLGDANALASALESLLSDAKRRHAIGARLRARALEKFAWDHSAKKIEQAYNALLQGKTVANFTPPESARVSSSQKSPYAK